MLCRLPRSSRCLAAAGGAARAGSFRSGVVGGLRAGRVLAAGDEVVQEAGEAVLLGALAVQGGLGAGELLAQRGDGVVRGGQLRCGGGELGGVPLLVVPAGAGGVAAGVLGCGQGGVAFGAGGGDGVLGGCALVLQGAGGGVGGGLGVLLDGAQDADDGGGIAASGMLMAAQRAGGWRVFRRRRRLADGAGCPGCRVGRVPAR